MSAEMPEDPYIKARKQKPSPVPVENQ
jgi:hypothetical protein